MSLYRTRKAKKMYRNSHPNCCVCNRENKWYRPNHVHHIIPVHVMPELADDPSNLATLCPWHHFWVGHCFNWKRWNHNFWETVFAVAMAYRDHVHMMEVQDDG